MGEHEVPLQLLHPLLTKLDRGVSGDNLFSSPLRTEHVVGVTCWPSTGGAPQEATPLASTPLTCQPSCLPMKADDDMLGSPQSRPRNLSEALDICVHPALLWVRCCLKHFPDMVCYSLHNNSVCSKSYFVKGGKETNRHVTEFAQDAS